MRSACAWSFAVPRGEEPLPGLLVLLAFLYAAGAVGKGVGELPGIGASSHHIAFGIFQQHTAGLRAADWECALRVPGLS